MPLKISHTDKFNTFFNGQSIHMEEGEIVSPPHPNNRPSAFTYAELVAIYGVIKPYRNKDQIADIREDLITHYDANYRPTNKLIGTIQGMRESIIGPTVFDLTKEAEPGHPSRYRGGLYWIPHTDYEKFETLNFQTALRLLRSHLKSDRVFVQSSPAPAL